MKATAASWDHLFTDPAAPCARKQKFRILRRERHELLAVPFSREFTHASLSLYLPQTLKARFAKRIFGLFWRSPLAGVMPSREVALHQTAFATFLASLAGDILPPFAVLSGNPAEAGRRYIFASFDPSGSAANVVKCGVDSVAQELIQRELTLMRTLGDDFPAVPPVLDAASGADFSAFAMPCLEELKKPLCLEERTALLGSWVRSGKEVCLADLPAWQRLGNSVSDVGFNRVRPVVFHGDFAPWNIRALTGKPMVIDWEKANIVGPPLWDLLHYEIQTLILVKRASWKPVLTSLLRLLDEPAVLRYLDLCKSRDHKILLTTGYLQHMGKTYPQIRGRDTVDALLAAWNDTCAARE